ncbi:MAG: hypothetical protein C7B47_09145 [Sulfobacillus thermosulfidooxidans]|uniref:Soluble P-type ATPase n=1 Tax=Sulfobacillus thermosulfidooxidans TaxID=28034 RepID=A0A2T2WXU8_SULTH|nr:MAG: hypothetical protein C7B47_09145 [Sulfobacillus thermosulfidooxidans]
MALSIDIPGLGLREYDHVVFDLNGTLATDGRISETMALSLQDLNKLIHVHILTAGTHGQIDTIRRITGIAPVLIQVAEDKTQYVKKLQRVIAVGNGANDTDMLQAADLAICVIGFEGAFTKTLLASDIVVRKGQDAIDLLLKPNRLKATLRL